MVTLDFEILRRLVGFSVRSRHPRHCCARSVLRGARLVGDPLRLRGVSTAAVLVSAALACRWAIICCDRPK